MKTHVMRTQSSFKSKVFTLTVSSILLAFAFILWPNVPSAISPPSNISSEYDGHSSLQVAFPLDKYSVVMSSVPGFPIEISEDHNNFPLIIATSSGELLVKEGSAGKQVRSSGASLELKEGNTIYWSPLAATPVSETSITVTSQSQHQNSAIKPVSIHISQDQDGFYKIN